MNISKMVLATKDRDVSLFPFYVFCRPFSQRLEEIIGENINPIVVFFFNNSLEYYIDEEVFVRVGKKVFDKYLDKSFYEKMKGEVNQRIDELENLTTNIVNSNYSSQSTDELIRSIQNLMELTEDLNTWGQLTSILEYGPNNFLSVNSQEILQNLNTKLSLNRKTVEDCSVLTSPTKGTFIRDEKIDMLGIALESLNMGFEQSEYEDFEKALTDSDLFELLKNHYYKYCWINFGYSGPPLDIKYFISELFEHLKKDRENLSQEIEFLKNEYSILSDQQSKLESIYELDNYWKYRYQMIREQTYYKEIRKEISFKVFYVVSLLQKEVASKLGINQKVFKYLLPEEYSLLISNNKKCINIANDREKYCALFLEENNQRIIKGDDAKKMHESFYSDILISDENKELKGSVACKGKANGIVKLIMGESHNSKLQKGEILVSYSTNPQMIPAMKKSSAILTEQGGIVSHASIVSRELNIPCVVGIKNITQILKDGDEVEVDANEGVVKILKRS